MADRHQSLIDCKADNREKRLIENLRQLYSDYEIELWLRLPHPQLQWRIPQEMIDCGRFEEVEAVVDRLTSGAYL